MNKKGFTLVELLAVIVILAIILLIAVPSVTKIVTEARKDTLVSSAKLISKAVKSDALQNNTSQYEIDSDGKLWRNIDPSDPNSEKVQIKYSGKVISSSDSPVIITFNLQLNLVIISENILCDAKKSWCLFPGWEISNITSGDLVSYKSVSTSESCFTFDEGTGTITNYNSSCGSNVVIPNEINSIDVTAIGYEAFYDKQLTNVIIPSSVTTMASNAFENNKLKSLILPSSVTKIPSGAFYNNSLISVVIPSGVTEIEPYAFENNKLESLSLPNSVTTLGVSAFENNKLTVVSLSNNISEIPAVVFFNNQIKSITIPTSVTSIGISAFHNNKLTSVTIPSSVTTIEQSAFSNNFLLEANTIIKNIKANVTIETCAFCNNGINGTEEIEPTFIP